MPIDTDRFIVITGGPGSGKSTMTAALRAAGLSSSDEVGRQIIRQQVAISGRALPWVEPELYAEMMLSWEMHSYQAWPRQPGTVVFDRGIPDVIGYLRLLGRPIPGHMDRAAKAFRYNRRDFIAPPWPAIYIQDAERKQTAAEAERTYHAMVETYRGYGYALIDLPRAPLAAGVRFLLSSGVQPNVKASAQCFAGQAGTCLQM